MAAAGSGAHGGPGPCPDSPPLFQRRRPRHQVPEEAVTLEKVLGITAQTSGALACDPATGLVAYPAGCVVVILNPRENTQRHILNPSRRTLSALDFSPDGKLIVTGENGSQPSVRVWDVEEGAQVSALRGHKHSVACVAFSPSAEFLVSVGHPHDMVNVWDWKKGSLVASNKVSWKVTAVSFSEDSYFVTVGHRRVKFWFLDSSRELKVNETVPLTGRSGLLGELHDNVFRGVACGRGPASRSTFCISSSGLLCQFNEKRVLKKWIALEVPLATCLCLGEELIFCGCANGTVRIFQACDLCYLSDLPKPHPLGVDVTQAPSPRWAELVYPDTIALAYDACNRWLSCVYKDHSIYVWHVGDLRNVRKVWSDLFHSSFVWSIEVYPEFEEQRSCLPPGSFLTCSSDNTIRVWNLESGSVRPVQASNYSPTLLNIVYVDHGTQHLQNSSGAPDQNDNADHIDVKSGVRVMQVSPDGEHLASGDRAGTLRIHELRFMREVFRVEAHDSEILCLEYSKPETGAALLASASRDRLIHILNIRKNYQLEQTLDDHSSAITSVRFGGHGDVRLISCGTDKSIYFRDARKLPDGFTFVRTHHVAEKTTLYDMDVDITQKYVAVACQDRNVRVYSADSGKLKCCYKGSQSDGGYLLKVQLDPSGTFLATSCSDKSISLIDFRSGECVAKMLGHSELVTGMRFTYDCKRLITVSGDSCIFVWHLGAQITSSMRQRLLELDPLQPKQAREPGAPAQLRWDASVTTPGGPAAPAANGAAEEEPDEASSPQTPRKEDSQPSPACILTNGRMPLWAKRLLGDAEAGAVASPPGSYRPQGRWAERAERGPIRTLLQPDPPDFTPLRPHPEGDVELRAGSLDHTLSEADSSLGDLAEDPQLSQLFPGEESNAGPESPEMTGPSLQELCVPERSRSVPAEADSRAGIRALLNVTAPSPGSRRATLHPRPHRALGPVTGSPRAPFRGILAMPEGASWAARGSPAHTTPQPGPQGPGGTCGRETRRARLYLVPAKCPNAGARGPAWSGGERRRGRSRCRPARPPPRRRALELPLRPVYPVELGAGWEDTSPCLWRSPGTPAPRPEDEDSAGSAGEVEEPEENPPQSESLPQTPEQEKYLRQHFETLVDADAGEKFNGSLKDLKPPEPGDGENRLFLNPRLSISARFLSRCQRNSRWAAGASPRLSGWRPPSSSGHGPGRRTRPLPGSRAGTSRKRLRSSSSWRRKPPDGKPWETGGESDSEAGNHLGSHPWIETFTSALELLRSRFQETLGLYDQVGTSRGGPRLTVFRAEALGEGPKPQQGSRVTAAPPPPQGTLRAEPEVDLLRARTALASLLGWVKAELRSRAVTCATDAATGTDAPAPPTPLDPKTQALLRAYSDTLVEMVRMRLEGSSPETV
ncbi:WD repeat-containing protein 62 [Rhynochetos jubatus]